jgi:hypothetical protein
MPKWRRPLCRGRRHLDTTELWMDATGLSYCTNGVALQFGAA